MPQSRITLHNSEQAQILCVSMCVLMLCAAFLLYACSRPEPQRAPVALTPPTAVPASGLYRTLPKQIVLNATSDTTPHYRWDHGEAQPYTEPIATPTEGPPHRILHIWTEDTSGHRSPTRQEHYVEIPKAPQVEFLGLDSTVMGPTDSATLRWRSSTHDATYTIDVTNSGWGPGKQLAQGTVGSHQIQETPIPGKALRAGENRLWLRVTDTAGVTAAISSLLTLEATPALTRVWPPSGVYGQPQNVRLINSRPATVYYTTDGSEPALNSARYTGPIHIDHTTKLRFFSVDAHGNQAAIQQALFTIQPDTVSIAPGSPAPHDASSTADLTFTWQSDRTGTYRILLQYPHKQVTVQQGSVESNQNIRSTITRNFLSPGSGQIRIEVRPEKGQPGHITFPITLYYEEHFADTRYLDQSATTAAWDINVQQVRLSRGPQHLSTYPTRGRSRQVVVRDDHAYLANGTGGLHILDVTKPDQPRRVGRFNPHGTATAVAVYADHVYMAAGGSGLIIFDVTQPSIPHPVATVPVRGAASDIAIEPPYAYVGTQNGSLEIFDLATPLQPQRMGQINVGGRVVDLAIHEQTAYLACLDQGLIIVDIQDPTAPRLLHRWATPSAATGVSADANRVYVAADRIEVLDVSRPEAPTRIGTHYMQSAYGTALLPPYILAAAGTNGIQVTPMDERGPIISIPTGHYAARLAVQGTLAILADTRGGLSVIDLGTPSTPQVIAKLDNIGTIIDVAWSGTMAYLADDSQRSSLVVVDLSQPATPRVVGRYHSEATTDVALWQNWALLSDNAGRLQSVNIEQPTRPRLRHTLSLPGKSQRLALKPPYVFVASDSDGIHIVEVSASGELHLRQSLSIPGRALDIALTDRTAYVAAVEGGIQLIDIRTPTQSVLTIPYRHIDNQGDHIIRLSISGNRLYAIDTQRGLQILQRLKDGTLDLQHSFRVPQGAPWGLTTVGPYLFVTTLLSSLYTFDTTNISKPVLLSTLDTGGSALTASEGLLYIAVRGHRGVPGGLEIVDAFAQISERSFQLLKPYGVVSLPGHQPDTHQVYRSYIFHTPGMATSTVISQPGIPMHAARLSVHDFWGSPGQIQYALSNDGGAHWHPAEPGVWLNFPSTGEELRWRASLQTKDSVITPHLDQLHIDILDTAPPRP